MKAVKPCRFYLFKTAEKGSIENSVHTSHAHS